MQKRWVCDSAFYEHPRNYCRVGICNGCGRRSRVCLTHTLEEIIGLTIPRGDTELLFCAPCRSTLSADGVALYHCGCGG